MDSSKRTGVIWTVLDVSRELSKNVSTDIEGLFVERAQVRVPVEEKGESWRWVCSL